MIGKDKSSVEAGKEKAFVKGLVSVISVLMGIHQL